MKGILVKHRTPLMAVVFTAVMMAVLACGRGEAVVKTAAGSAPSSPTSLEHPGSTDHAVAATPPEVIKVGDRVYEVEGVRISFPPNGRWVTFQRISDLAIIAKIQAPCGGANYPFTSAPLVLPDRQVLIGTAERMLIPGDCDSATRNFAIVKTDLRGAAPQEYWFREPSHVGGPHVLRAN